jgi:hypothetical protein
MWNREKTKRLIEEVTEKYGKEIAIEGSESVLGLEEHLDRMVAKLMGVDLEVIKIARHWRAVIKRAAITEGIDRVKLLLETENETGIIKEDYTPVEVEMRVEEEPPEESETLDMQDIVTEVEIEENRIVLELDKQEKKHGSMEDIIPTETTKEAERKEKERKIVLENLEDIRIAENMNTSLDKSIWAPKKESCKNKRDIQAKVVATNVAGEISEHREKSLRWVLRENTHVKKITEEFTKGNQWCVITFDCEKGYEEAKRKLENPKEDFEKLRLFPKDVEEEQTKNINAEKAEKSTEKRNRKTKREKQAQEELEEIFKQRKKKTPQGAKEEKKTKEQNSIKLRRETEEKKPIDKGNQITVWDLPKWTRRSQVFESVRHFGRVAHIEMIREASNKTRAEIEFTPETANKKELEETWCIPFTKDYLVRVTLGTNNIEELRARNKFTRKIIDLPENTNEVLLWRQVKRTGAKSLHIFKNTNNNNMRSATVYFSQEKDFLESTRCAIYYYNNKLRWATERSGIYKRENNTRQQEGKYKKTETNEKEWNRDERTESYEENSMEGILGLKRRRGESSKVEESEDEEIQDNWEEEEEEQKEEAKNKEGIIKKKSPVDKEKHETKEEESLQLDIYSLFRKLEEKLEVLKERRPNRS